MARSFTAASSHKLTRTAAINSGALPLTLACWFNPTDVTARRVLMGLYSSSSDTPLISLDFAGDIGGDPVRIICRDDAATLGFKDTTAGATAGSWFHAAAVIASGSSRRVFLNGGNAATDTTATGTTTLNRTGIGVRNGVTDQNFMNGLIAEAGAWNAALTDDDILALSLGFSPLLVAPESLIFYCPLFGVDSPEPDYSNGSDMTVTGATIADHPNQVYVEDGPRVIMPAAAATIHNPYYYRHLAGAGSAA